MLISDSEIDDRPRSLRDPAARQRRTAMLDDPHMAKLVKYVKRLRRQDLGQVPDFDPLDGGAEARVLFLFEKPGRMTIESGFISSNNDDRTAEATFKFMRQAHIPRKQTVIWNIVPWWNGTRKMTPRELSEGNACVAKLISLLGSLRAVVLVGSKAAKAKPFLDTAGLRVFRSWHPSPVVEAVDPDRWKAIPSEWRKVLPYIGI